MFLFKCRDDAPPYVSSRWWKTYSARHATCFLRCVCKFPRQQSQRKSCRFALIPSCGYLPAKPKPKNHTSGLVERYDLTRWITKEKTHNDGKLERELQTTSRNSLFLFKHAPISGSSFVCALAWFVRLRYKLKRGHVRHIYVQATRSFKIQTARTEYVGLTFVRKVLYKVWFPKQRNALVLIHFDKHTNERTWEHSVISRNTTSSLHITGK